MKMRSQTLRATQKPRMGVSLWLLALGSASGTVPAAWPEPEPEPEPEPPLRRGVSSAVSSAAASGAAGARGSAAMVKEGRREVCKLDARKLIDGGS